MPFKYFAASLIIIAVEAQQMLKFKEADDLQ